MIKYTFYVYKPFDHKLTATDKIKKVVKNMHSLLIPNMCQR